MRSKQGTRQVDVAQVLEKAAELVAEFGEDYVYARPPSDICQYVHEDKPSCLVGQILVRLGAPINNLWVVEATQIAENGHGLGVEDLLEKLDPTWSTLGFTLTEPAIKILVELQNIQDTNNTWGIALDGARHLAEDMVVTG